MTKSLRVIALLLLFSSLSAVADISYVCTSGGQERVITVAYENAGASVPCKVTYSKDSDTNTLWNADQESGYCEAKAEEFAKKQEGWGWKCEKVMADQFSGAKEPASEASAQE